MWKHKEQTTSHTKTTDTSKRKHTIITQQQNIEHIHHATKQYTITHTNTILNSVASYYADGLHTSHGDGNGMSEWCMRVTIDQMTLVIAMSTLAIAIMLALITVIAVHIMSIHLHGIQ